MFTTRLLRGLVPAVAIQARKLEGTSLVTSRHKMHALGSRRWKSIMALSLGALLAVGIFYGSLSLGGNFHMTVPGELYRSAQPTARQIASYAKLYGIKTIVNLRGENIGAPWYDAEVAEAKQLGIRHLDFRMSARQQLSQTQAKDLVALMRKAEKPILIHCLGGADRSGLVAALYVAAIARGSENVAESQISIRFGHFSVSANPAYAMDRAFESLEPWLGFKKS